jgi:hypothetical protein
MFTRKTTLALAAVASLAALALATDAASAHGFGGGVRGFRGGSSYHFTSVRRIGPPPIIIGHHPHPHWAWRHHYWVAPVVATGVATAVVTAPTVSTWNRCSCLTKNYTPEGAVVFKDVCTQETAMNPPAQPASYDPGQDPAAQGSLQPQMQSQAQAQAQAQAQPLMPQTAVPQVR